MLTASARVLRLLALLQVRREWSGDEISARLDITPRTVRRDVARLRQLGYVIDAAAGPGGGYRLGAGAATPPLLLDDDEAVAVAVALGAAAGNVTGDDDVGLRVLAKLDQLLPRRLRRRLSALPAVTLSLANPQSAVSLSVLAAIAAACRDSLQLRFAYRDSHGKVSLRMVEPMRLVHTGYRWYLAAWDLDRADWRTFRVDRIQAPARLTASARFTPRQPPKDFATLVAEAIKTWPTPYRARVRLEGSVAALRPCIPEWLGTLEPFNDRQCILSLAAETHHELAAMILFSGVEFTLLEPRALTKPLRAAAARLRRGLQARS